MQRTQKITGKILLTYYLDRYVPWFCRMTNIFYDGSKIQGNDNYF